MALDRLLRRLLPREIENIQLYPWTLMSLRAGNLCLLFQQLLDCVSFFEYLPMELFTEFLFTDTSGAAFASTPLLHETKMNHSIFSMIPFQLEILVILLVCNITMGIIIPIMALCVKDAKKAKYLKISMMYSFMIILGRCMNAILMYSCLFREDRVDDIFHEYHQSSAVQQKLLRLFYPGVLGSFGRKDATLRVLLQQFYYGIYMGFIRWVGTNVIFCFYLEVKSKSK